MRAVSKIVLSIAVTAGAGTCCQEARAQEQSYQLAEGEYAFVAGTEYSELLVAMSADSTSILLNNVPIAFRSSFVHRHVAQAEDAGGGDYSAVPFVSRMVQGGMATADAVSLCRQKEAAFRHLMMERAVSVGRGGAAEESWAAEVQGWTGAPENQGIVKFINKERGGYSYMLWSDTSGGMEVYNTGLVIDEPAPAEPTVESVAAQVIGFLRNGSGDQLVVLGEGGGGAYISGRQGVAAALEQIDAARNRGAYIAGPFSERQLSMFGLIEKSVK